MIEEKVRLAAAIHLAADLLSERNHELDALDEARNLVEAANEILSVGVERDLEDRLHDFAAQMVVPMGASVIQEGETFPSFVDSPYSGKQNALSPRLVEYERVGNAVHAKVLMGPAFEGAPGRAHGGTTAAIFDDVMGATQRVTGLSGYTRTLEVTYFGPLPTNETVVFKASVSAQDETSFTVDAEAIHESRVVASSRGVFTLMTAERFTSSS